MRRWQPQKELRYMVGVATLVLASSIICEGLSRPIPQPSCLPIDCYFIDYLLFLSVLKPSSLSPSPFKTWDSLQVLGLILHCRTVTQLLTHWQNLWVYLFLFDEVLYNTICIWFPHRSMPGWHRSCSRAKTTCRSWSWLIHLLCLSNLSANCFTLKSAWATVTGDSLTLMNCA